LLQKMKQLSSGLILKEYLYNETFLGESHFLLDSFNYEDEHFISEG